MKFLPTSSNLNTSKQATRSSFGSKSRLDKDGLQKLDQQRQSDASPVRGSSLSKIAAGISNVFKRSASKGKGPGSQTSENK